MKKVLLSFFASLTVGVSAFGFGVDSVEESARSFNSVCKNILKTKLVAEMKFTRSMQGKLFPTHNVSGVIAKPGDIIEITKWNEGTSVSKNLRVSGPFIVLSVGDDTVNDAPPGHNGFVTGYFYVRKLQEVGGQFEMVGSTLALKTFEDWGSPDFDSYRRLGSVGHR